MFHTNNELWHIETKFVSVEASNSMTYVERYHTPNHHAYKIVTAETPEIDDETALQMAKKSENDSTGLDVLVPTLFVYGALPRLGFPATIQHRRPFREPSPYVKQPRPCPITKSEKRSISWSTAACSSPQISKRRVDTELSHHDLFTMSKTKALQKRTRSISSLRKTKATKNWIIYRCAHRNSPIPMHFCHPSLHQTESWKSRIMIYVKHSRKPRRRFNALYSFAFQAFWDILSTSYCRPYFQYIDYQNLFCIVSIHTTYSTNKNYALSRLYTTVDSCTLPNVSHVQRDLQLPRGVLYVCRWTTLHIHVTMHSSQKENF